MAATSNTRKRLAIASIAVLVVVVVIAAVLVIDTRHAGPGHVDEDAPSKQVSATRLSRIDALVVLRGTNAATGTDVRRALDATDAVIHYAPAPAGAPALVLRTLTAPGDDDCAALALHGYAVELADGHSTTDLKSAIGTDAAVWPGAGAQSDIEIFMKLGAPRDRVDPLLGALRRDPDVASVRYIDH